MKKYFNKFLKREFAAELPKGLQSWIEFKGEMKRHEAVNEGDAILYVGEDVYEIQYINNKALEEFEALTFSPSDLDFIRQCLYFASSNHDRTANLADHLVKLTDFRKK